jgi:DNA-binding SARP family transcriptional activator
VSLLEIRLFGEPVLTFEGAPWRFAPPPRTVPLLAYLALRPGTPVTRARLAALLWPDDPEEDARGKLRRHLHQLQKALPQGIAWVDVQSGSVCWNAQSPALVDVVEFERFAAGESTYARAVDLYGDDFMGTLVDEWIITERERLRAMQLDMLYALGTCARDERRFKDAAQFASRILVLDPWREDAIRLEMSAKYELGDRSAAIAAYDRFTERLQAELGVDPMPETQALRYAIVGNARLAPPLREHGEEEPQTAQHERRLPLAGREDELARLTSAWDRAARGFGTTVFVSGEAGIGKSRLAFELASIARAQGGRVLNGGVSDPESEPYQPVLAALRTGIACCVQADVPGPWLSALAEVLPEIHGVRAGISPSGVLEADRAQQRLFEALARMLEAISRQKPLLLVLEDLHWAGEPTLELLRFLAPRLGSLPLLIVATYRTGGSETPALLSLRRKLLQEHRAIGVSLTHLTHGDLAQLVADAGVFGDAPEDLVPRVALLSGGNALFATQLLYGYVESRTLPDASSALETIGSAIAARFERLEGRTRAIAQAAATAGETFASDLVASIGGWPEHEVLDAFDVLIDKGMIREAGAVRLEYAFSHALIAQALYESTTERERKLRHRRIASLLERRSDGDRSQQGAIARHWMLAGEFARARAAHQRAGEAALAVYARADAVPHARAALDLAQNDRERFESLLLLAKAQMRSADVERWRADVDGAVAVARGLNDETQLYEALKAREAYQMQTGDRDGQRVTILEMLDLASGDGMRAQRVAALDLLGNLERLIGRLEDGAALHRQALALAELGTDRATISSIHRHLVQSLSRLGDIEGVTQQVRAHRALLAQEATPAERLDLLASEVSLLLALDDEQGVREKGNEILAAAQLIGDLALQGQAHLIIAHYFRDGEDAREHYEAAGRLGEQIGERLLFLTAMLNWGSTEAEFGCADRAIELASIALPIAREIQAPAQTCFALVTLSEAHRINGDLEQALRYANEAVEIIAGSSDKRTVASAHLVLGMALLERGNSREGIAAMERAAALRREAKGQLALAEALAHLAVAYLDAHDPAAAIACGAQLLECVESSGLRRNAPLFCWALARVAQARGDRSEAFKWSARGQTAVAERLRSVDGARAAGYCRLPYVRDLSAPGAVLPEKSTARRNS